MLGELTGEVGQIIEAVSILTEVLDGLARDHSPLDWGSARPITEMARALEAVGHSDRLTGDLPSTARSAPMTGP